MNTLARVTVDGRKPRILLLTSQYFVMGEIQAALQRLDVPHLLLDLAAKEMDLDAFVRLITQTLSEFRPDYVLTVNHLALDREGVLASILHRAGLPLVSWFVDNPFLILDAYAMQERPKTVLFTWDVDTVQPLRQLGFDAVFHLPLGADPTRFVPADRPVPEAWKARVSFVGNSMKDKTEKRFMASRPNFTMVEAGFDLAEGFMASDDRTAREFIVRTRPDVAEELAELPMPRRLAYETYITWLATCIYRRTCIKQTMPFEPLIVGDKGWKELYKHYKGWRYHKELSYYEDLPLFYPASEVNFNCTSKQMKGAVNQRVFDVPCCGAFLLTDHRMQIEELFEPGKEVAVYHTPDEVPGLLERYLADPAERARIAEAGRKRVLAQHTYDHRMVTLIENMRTVLG